MWFGAPALALAVIWWITRPPERGRVSVLAMAAEWRVDRCRVTVGGETFRRANVVLSEGVARLFKASGELVATIEGARRVPVSASSWEIRDDQGQVWSVKTGRTCCGG